jgi:hypothetical protein
VCGWRSSSAARATAASARPWPTGSPRTPVGAATWRSTSSTWLTTRLPDALVDDDQPPPAPVRALAPRLAAADAFVVVTPEYDRSFRAPLKTAIDRYLQEWRAKPVAIVSYGGQFDADGSWPKASADCNAAAKSTLSRLVW